MTDLNEKRDQMAEDCENAGAKTMTDLNKKRDEMAVQYSAEINDNRFPENEEDFKAGWDAAVETLAAMSGEWNEPEAINISQELYKAEDRSQIHAATRYRWVFVDGARWQHSKMSPQIAALREENERLREALEKCLGKFNNQLDTNDWHSRAKLGADIARAALKKGNGEG